MLRHAVTIACILVLAAIAPAQTLPNIHFEKYTLKNGLDVILCVNKKIPAVNVNLWYHVGSKNEATGKTGFAHLFEHMMFQGSKHVVGEYLALVEQAGANLRAGGVNGTTNTDRTNYFETVPTHSLEYALWLEADRMGFLDEALTQEKFANQQDVVRNEKRQGDNAPYAAVQYAVAEHLYPMGHPYGHTVIGSIEDLTNATLDDVREFYNTWYVPNNCSLALVGDFDPDDAKELIQKYFGPLAPGKPRSRPGVNIPFLPRNKTVRILDRVPQARLQLVYPVPHHFTPEEASLDYAASILGHGKTARLYRTLVRDQQLASNVVVYNAAREIAGEFHVIVTARPGVDLARLRAVVDSQFADFAENGPSKDELERLKVETSMNFLGSLERIGGFGGIADRLNSYNTYLGNPDYFQRDHDRYQAITTADVRRDFQRWIADAHRLEVWVEPETSGRPDAEEFDRSVPPSTDGPVVFDAPRTERRTLDNGLEVVVSPRPGLPLVSTRLIIKTQDVNESEEKAGRSTLTAAMLDEGTITRSALQIQEELDRLGARMSVGGGKTGASVSLRCMTEKLDDAFEILTDIVLNPAFDELEFERQRKMTLDGLRRSMSEPGYLATRLFQQKLYGEEHPLGRSSDGTASSIAAITTADLRETWSTYWRPNNATLLFVGDITIERAVEIAQLHLGAWREGKLPMTALRPAPRRKARTIYLVDRQGAPQSEIRIGAGAPARKDPDYHAMQLTNALLGGAFSSRLNLNLREDKGYTYGAFCRLAMARDHGWWMATAGVQSKFTTASLHEFRKEIEGLAGTIPIRPDELRNVQRNLTLGFVQNFESNDMVAGQLSSLLNDDAPLSALAEFVPAIEQGSPEAVTAMARKHYGFDGVVVVIVGDLSEIEAPVRALGWGEVVVLDADGREQ